eukprot:3091669-Pleurochrysis_carterae.AAC.1
MASRVIVCKNLACGTLAHSWESHSCAAPRLLKCVQRGFQAPVTLLSILPRESMLLSHWMTNSSSSLIFSMRRPCESAKDHFNFSGKVDCKQVANA